MKIDITPQEAGFVHRVVGNCPIPIVSPDHALGVSVINKIAQASGPAPKPESRIPDEEQTE